MDVFPPAFDMFQRLALALGLGFVIGIERGWQARGEDVGHRIAGVRTFALIGLLGGLWAVVSEIIGPTLLGFGFLAFAALMISAHILSVREFKDFGITTMVAALITFSLGAIAVMGNMAIAAAAAVATLGFLSVKEGLHAWLERLREAELLGAIKLLAISVVVLPVLPNKGFGPGATLNPYELWWMVVLVSGISFFGYVAVNYLGPRAGPLITGVFGGLCSSTALTLSFSRLARTADRALRPALAGGIATAGAITLVRILAVTFVFHPPLAVALALPLGLAFAVIALGALFVAFRFAGEEASSEISFGDPAELGSAIGFGVLLAVIVLIAHYAEEFFGTRGLYALGAIAGLADVDAITLSMARTAGDDTRLAAATATILIAALSNTIVKGALVGAIAGGRTGIRVAGIYVAGIAAGAAGFVLA